MKKSVMFLAFALALACNAAKPADLALTQIVPTTGAIAPNGLGLQAGGKAYIDSVNATGGVNGQKIVLHNFDDQYKPDETVRLFQKSAAENHPLAFMNFTGAANIELLIKSGELDKNKIPLIGPRAGGQSLRNPVNPFIFHTYSATGTKWTAWWMSSAAWDRRASPWSTRTTRSAGTASKACRRR